DVNATLRGGSVGGHAAKHDRVPSIEGHVSPRPNEDHGRDESHAESPKDESPQRDKGDRVSGHRE
ncbi:hypothetical protein KI387_033698, partial [Taxus chinensis]